MGSDMMEGTEDLVAVVGMGCRWPGGISSPSQFWDFLVEKRSASQDFERNRFNIDGFYHPNRDRPGSLPMRSAHLLNDDPKLFDHRFFGMSPVEVRTMDPAQRKLLEVVYESFENAGEPMDRYRGSNTGVFIGNFNNDHSLIQASDTDSCSVYSSTGSTASILSNRINYLMDLRGPSMTIDTACSSSMYALHLATSAIQRGDCDSAIVGGANLIMNADVQLMLSKLGALSSTSICHTFDSSADGYARGEGFAAFYLKRLNDATNNNYPIRAVIRGTAINSNGKSAGLTQPDVAAQEAVIRQAYRNARLPTTLTGFFETHGTGTPIGDPIEVRAIGNVFSSERSSEPLLIGSVKTNVGHTEAASGLVSIMKAILALEAGFIPATIGLKTPNPQIDFANANVKVVTELTPWPRDKLRRASVNSFGFGGANSHCVLDHISVLRGDEITVPDLYTGDLDKMPSPDEVSQSSEFSETDAILPSSATSSDEAFPVPTEPCTVPLFMGSRSRAESPGLILLPFSAHDADALRAYTDTLDQSINDFSLADVAYTLSCRRSKFQYRSYAIISAPCLKGTIKNNLRSPGVTTGMQKPSVGFIFTGQGAQWEAMGAPLLQHEVFNVLRNKSSRSIQAAEVSQTVCTALQIGLVDLLKVWKVSPKAVVGHSSGEIAAAYSAGELTAAEAIVIAYCRGLSVSKNIEIGGMLAVGLSREEVNSALVEQELVSEVNIAAVNSLKSVTVSGDLKAIDDLERMFRAKGVFVRALQTGNNAYHSFHMLSIGPDYEDMITHALQKLEEFGLNNRDHRYPKSVWVSSVTPKERVRDPPCSYWRQNLESTVQFSSAVDEILNAADLEVDLLVELGPHSALKAPISEAITLSARAHKSVYSASLKRGEDGMKNLLELCGSLFCANYPVELAAVNSLATFENEKLMFFHGQVCTNLPPYHFTYGPILYHEGRLSKEKRLRKYLRHDILGVKQPGVSKTSPSWRNILRLKDLPWLDHHKLLPHPVFPASGYICMAVEAASQTFGDESPNRRPTAFTLRDVSISSAMKIPSDDRGLEVILDLKTHDVFGETWCTFEVSSISTVDGAWTNHCAGSIIAHSSGTTPMSRLPRLARPSDPRHLDAKKWYHAFFKMGLGYGTTFQGISNLASNPWNSVVTADISLKPTEGTFTGSESPYVLHPASIDACHQLGIISGFGGHITTAHHGFVPVYIKKLAICQPDEEGATSALATCHSRRMGVRGLHAQIQLTSDSGALLLDIEDLRCISYGGNDEPNKLEIFKNVPYRKLVWRPDLSYMSNQTAQYLFPPTTKSDLKLVSTIESLNCLSAYLVVEIAERYTSKIGKLNAPSYVEKFISWIKESASDASVPFTSIARGQSNSERMHTIFELVDELQDNLIAVLMKRIFDHIDEILVGTTSGLDVALEGGLLRKVYSSSLGIATAYPQMAQLLDLLAHKNPNMNIIEIGAGTGSATRVAMDTLNGRESRRYNRYTYTDVSNAFFTAAAAEFTDCAGMAYKLLDAQQSALDQGFQPIYDLVLASQSIHTVRDIPGALRNIRRLLKPSGKLLIVETVQPSLVHGLAFGSLPDYWVGTDSHSMRSPFMDTAHWNEALVHCGFSGVDVELLDHSPPYNIASTMISTALHECSSIHATEIADTNTLWLVCSPDYQHIALKVTEVAERHLSTILIDPSELGTIPCSARIIWFVNLRCFTSISVEDELAKLQHMVRSANSMLWVTNSDITHGKDASGSILNGLIRVISGENPDLRCATVDVDTRPEECSPALVEFLLGLEEQLQGTQDGIPRDREFVWKHGCAHISRIVAEDFLNEQFELAHHPNPTMRQVPIVDQKPLAVAFEKTGILNSLYFKEDDMFCLPVPDGYIEVKTEAIGLNWKDISVITGKSDRDNFSSEFAGVVVKTGKNVNDFKIGDRVYGFALGQLGNFLRLPHEFAHPMGLEDSFTDMATIPIVFASALYALSHVARMQKGETILIQSATGGLGLAAIQIAQMIGANVFATAGSEHQRAYLHDTLSIPEGQVFSSRELLDFECVQQATGRRGFDVIFSNSSGMSLDQSWRCIAARGRFIDVGRVDVQSHSSLNMEPFSRNATFSSFDLERLFEQEPEYAEKLLYEVHQLVRNKAIRPISPVTTFDVSQLNEALTRFSEGSHIGKFVVTYQDPKAMIKMTPSIPRATFNSEAAYVIVGGLGGLGRSMMSWMIERGAQHFFLLSRKGNSDPKAMSCLDDFKSRTMSMQAISCDITVKDDIFRALEQISKSIVVKGIIHTAMTLQDKLFHNLSGKEWANGLSAKVNGTINLHDATASLSLPLDFFVMTSSISTQIAQATQSAYCAANSFQDYFARYRRKQGLPTTTISFGLITEIGEVGRRDDVRRSMGRNNLYEIGEYEFLQLLEAAFLPRCSERAEQSGTDQLDPLSDAHIITSLEPAKLLLKQNENQERGVDTQPRWHRDIRFSHVLRDMQNIDEDKRNNASVAAQPALPQLQSPMWELEAHMKQDDLEKANEAVAQAIVRRVADILFMPTERINPSHSVVAHGVDSLIAAELRNWFVTTYKFQISFLKLLDTSTSIQDLARLVVEAYTKRSGE